MPIDLSKYPQDWKQIAYSIKEAADWTCQECGRPCRRPGVEWCDFVEWLLNQGMMGWYEQTSDELTDDDTGEHGHIERPQRFTLTVAHLDHTPMNCARSNLKALCSGCHLRYDRFVHAKNATATRYRKREQQGQLNVLDGVQ